MRAFKEKAYAKINLFLDVRGKRTDGFHEIKTVMHSVSLADDITVTVKKSSTRTVKIFVQGESYLPTDSKNLAVKAANAFLDKLGLISEIEIKLNKNIPVSAGLAGGSSDAAAVLRALNRAFKRPLSHAALLDLGATVGSDVPYCIVGKTALCLGRGEEITPLPSVKLFTVIAISDERVSTPQAYSMLDERFSDFNGKVATAGGFFYPALESFLLGNGKFPKKLYNVFEDVLLDRLEATKNLRYEMSALGATCALMSGSGPSVFGIFTDEKSAKHAESELRNKGYSAFFAKSV